MAPPRERLLALAQVSCRIFATAFNPTGIRTGNKILRQRLKGPALLDYYPRRVATIQDMRRTWPEMVFPDVDEDIRQSGVEKTKARGKGAPKKVRKKPEKPGGKK